MKPDWVQPCPKVEPEGPDHVTEETVDEVHARSGGWCECSDDCTDRAEVIHHKRLRSQGGTHLPDNLAHLSDRHHKWCHDNPAEAASRGLIIRNGGNRHDD